MSERIRISAISLYPDKGGADEVGAKIHKTIKAKATCSHREIYLAGLYLYKISPRATKLIAENLADDSDLEGLIQTLKAAKTINNNIISPKERQSISTHPETTESRLNHQQSMHSAFSSSGDPNITVESSSERRNVKGRKSAKDLP